MKNEEILKSLKFKSRKDEWYVEGTWAELESNCHEFSDDENIENGWGLFNGWTNETFDGFKGLLPRWDGETCVYKEFDIFYEFDDKTYIQVNTMTLGELSMIIRHRSIKKVFDEITSTGMVSLTWAMKNILGMSEEQIKRKLKKDGKG